MLPIKKGWYHAQELAPGINNNNNSDDDNLCQPGLGACGASLSLPGRFQALTYL